MIYALGIVVLATLKLPTHGYVTVACLDEDVDTTTTEEERPTSENHLVIHIHLHT